MAVVLYRLIVKCEEGRSLNEALLRKNSRPLLDLLQRCIARFAVGREVAEVSN